MHIKIVTLVLVGFAIASYAEADTVTISSDTPFAEDSGVSDNVKRECKLESRFPKYVKDYAKKHTDVVLSNELLEGVEGKVLYLEFEHVFAPGGGGYSGAKSVSVVGELRENGEVIGSLTAERNAHFGMTPGTCSMLKRAVKKLGQDVGNWLASPTMDAMLGNAGS